MSFTHSITTIYSATGSTVSNIQTQTAGGEGAIQDTIVIGATDAVVGWSMDISQIKSFIITATGALTIKTYLATVLKDTIAVAAGIPLLYVAGGQLSLAEVPITSDFDQIKVTNATGVDVVLEIRSLFDPTV